MTRREAKFDTETRLQFEPVDWFRDPL